MFLWLMVFIGSLLFVLGLYFLIKNYKQGIYIKKYGLISYIGFALTLLGTILLMEPFFTSLPGNLSAILPGNIGIFSLILISNLLLKPTFLKHK